MHSTQGDDKIKALALLLASPDCVIAKLYLWSLNVCPFDDNNDWSPGPHSQSIVVPFELSGMADHNMASLSKALKVNRTLEKLDVTRNKIESIDESLLLKTLEINSTLTHLEIDQNNGGHYHPDYADLTSTIAPILLKNKNLQNALPYARLSLALASDRSFPGEITDMIAQQLAFLPPSKREEGRSTIHALSAAIQPPGM